MAIKEKEYLFSVNSFKEPKVLTGKEAIAQLLVELIMLDPGSDPLHPDMGVGIKNYRYAMGKLDELKSRIKSQINTYLPDFAEADVELDIDATTHICNIDITINDTVYEYNSAEAEVPITIDDAQV